jgi:phage shock protein C
MSYEKSRLYRSDNGVIFGVCEGIAEHFDLNGWAVRLVWVLLTILGAPFTIIAYIGLALALKRRPIGLAAPANTYECQTHSEVLQRVSERFDRLDKRLQRMESVVTRPSFELERQYADL